MAIVTRTDLALAVHEEAGLTRRAARMQNLAAFDRSSEFI